MWTDGAVWRMQNATDMDSLDINPSQDFDGVWEMGMLVMRAGVS